MDTAEAAEAWREALERFPDEQDALEAKSLRSCIAKANGTTDVEASLAHLDAGVKLAKALRKAGALVDGAVLLLQVARGETFRAVRRSGEAYEQYGKVLEAEPAHAQASRGYVNVAIATAGERTVINFHCPAHPPPLPPCLLPTCSPAPCPSRLAAPLTLCPLPPALPPAPRPALLPPLPFLELSLAFSAPKTATVLNSRRWLRGGCPGRPDPRGDAAGELRDALMYHDGHMANSCTQTLPSRMQL